MSRFDQAKIRAEEVTSKVFDNAKCINVQGGSLTVAFIVAASVQFCILAVPTLPLVALILITILFGYSMIQSISCWIITSKRNPGFVPRERTQIYGEVDKLTSESTPTYCGQCEQDRPLLAKHCSLCGRCVEEFDHHCPWVMNCIGKYNYALFFKFLVWASVTGCVVMGASIYSYCIKQFGGIFQLDPGQQLIAFIVCAVVNLMYGSFALSMSCGHCRLILQGITTNQSLQMTRDKVEKPKRELKNWKRRLGSNWLRPLLFW